MAFKLTPRNLEPTTALEKTLRSIVDTDTPGTVKLGVGDDVALAGAVTDKIGMYGVTPVVQAATIADPTDEASNVVAIKAILVALENIGIVASS